MSQPAATIHAEAKSDTLARLLEEIQEMVSACMQCGTCTASCPNSFAMDLTPRQMWRMLLFGMTEEVFQSRTYWLCSSCYTCTLRCPRGLPLTRAMAALKRLASLKDLPELRKKASFYRVFTANIERHGRVQEMDLMMRYFFAMKDPLLPLRFTPLGIKMLRRGKLHPGSFSSSGGGKLQAMFAKAKTLEGSS